MYLYVESKQLKKAFLLVIKTAFRVMLLNVFLFH